MTPMDEYHLKQQIQKQKRQLEDLQKELEKDQKGKLTDREKFILHFVSMITISKLSGIAHPNHLIAKMIEDVRRSRCRSISPEDIKDLLEEINEEMVSGKLMFHHLMEDTEWSMTGERPNKNTNWRDMR